MKIDSGSISADWRCEGFRPGPTRTMNFTYEVDGTLAGTLYLQQRNSPNEDWDTVDEGTWPTHPAGAGCRDTVEYTECGATEYAVFLDVTSGTGHVYLDPNMT